MTTTVTIGGSPPDALLDVREDGKRDGDLGSATIVVGATDGNKSGISSGDDVTIARSGSIAFTGYVTGKEMRPERGELEVKAIEGRIELKHETVHQVFYETTSSDAVERAVSKRARRIGLQEVHVGSGTADWSSNAPVFETYGGSRAGLYNWGTDLVFVGARSGLSSTIQATYEDVGPGSISDGIFELRTRLLVNDPGGVWDLEIELVTPSGTHYVWEPEIEGQGFTSYKLKAEEATSAIAKTSGSGRLQYRFTPGGETAENTGIFIDNAHVIPFMLGDRPTAITTENVQTTTREITRKADQSAAEFISELATEDRFSWWVDNSDDLHYEESGGETLPSLGIEEGATPVTSVEVNRDFEGIRNVVTVQGAGDIEETARDTGSIEFYGVNPREEPIVDKTLQSSDEAQARAEGYLQDHAWSDTLAVFEVADRRYADLGPGDAIPVAWGSAGLDGVYTVSSVSRDKAGVAEVAIGASAGDRRT